jgi:hypothetical protein
VTEQDEGEVKANDQNASFTFPTRIGAFFRTLGQPFISLLYDDCETNSTIEHSSRVSFYTMYGRFPPNAYHHCCCMSTAANSYDRRHFVVSSPTVRPHFVWNLLFKLSVLLKIFYSRKNCARRDTSMG